MRRTTTPRRRSQATPRPLAGPHLATDAVAVLHQSPTVTRAAVRVYPRGSR